MRHVLTGAGSGIGLALAHRLADRGDDLVLVARSQARADEIGRTFPRAQLLVADLADPGTLNGLGRQVDGEVDTVLHVAEHLRESYGERFYVSSRMKELVEAGNLGQKTGKGFYEHG